MQLLFLVGCVTEPTVTEDESILQGGGTTIFDETSSAFKAPAPNLSKESMAMHTEGDAAFEATFITSPAPLNGGLGPIFNNTSCNGCHVRNGRGLPIELGQKFSSMLFRISTNEADTHGEPKSIAGFGDQIQDRAIFGIAPEAAINLSYQDSVVVMSDGEKVILHVPHYTVQNSYKPLPSNLKISPRVAPPVFGLGLLEAISEQDILKNADEQDTDKDGISGKPNYVWSHLQKKKVIGRFGLKSNQPDLYQQTAAAFNGDMGITTSMFMNQPCHNQIQCHDQKDTVEINDNFLLAATHYSRTLAVPARRNTNKQSVKEGKELFEKFQCSKCHTPSHTTSAMVGYSELSNQKIFPYTDLLLHDLGTGLADGRDDYLANGTEWRTAPLWGIGLTNLVNGHTNFLHDGRAKSLIEAILWHSGEAEDSKEKFRTATNQERNSLIDFLNSL